MKTSSRKSTTKSRKSTAAPRKKAAPAHTASYEKAVKNYGDALKAFRRGDHAKAISFFDDIIEKYPYEREICDRARIYSRVSRVRMEGPARPPRGAEETYHRGVMAANDGHLDEATELFEKLVTAEPQSDRGHYALAAVCGQKNDAGGATANLSRAIEIDSVNRIHALNDDDFESLREDVAFMELLGKESEGSA